MRGKKTCTSRLLMRLSALCAALFVFSYLQAATPTDLYLLVGKSDLSGMGPAFVREMSGASSQVGLVSCAVGGSPLELWMPGGALYTNALARAKAALGWDGRLKGILWNSGEAGLRSRAGAESGPARLAEMIGAFRRDLGDEYMPFVAGGAGFPREVLKRVAAMGVVSGTGADELGSRFAAEMKRLQASPGFGMKRSDWYDARFTWRPGWKWRGFNLQGMRNAKGEPYFREEHFRWMREWGFNTCRLPVDYRYWVKGRTSDNMFEIDENCRELKALDQAIGWARKHRIHVLLNLHRIPGSYCAPLAAPPAETRVLWDDVEAQRAAVSHWEMLARRYRGIPREELSFNLVNEPNPPSGAHYAYVMKQLIAAIRRIDPDRFIVLDGIRGGTVPCREVFGIPGVGLAARGYQPFEFSHQGGIGGGFAPDAGVLTWPIDCDAPCVRLSTKRDFPGWSGRPLSVLDAPAGEWRAKFSSISGRRAVIAAFADGEKVAERAYEIREGDPAWANISYYQGNTNSPRARPVGQDFVFTLAKPANRLELRMLRGDWAWFATLNHSTSTLVGLYDVHMRTNRHNVVRYESGKGFVAIDAEAKHRPDWRTGQETVYRWNFAEWDEAIRRGEWVIVGEMGVAATVDAPSSLAFLRDLCDTAEDVGFAGWLNWGFIGSSFGVLDTARKDVRYERFNGHRLDRAMLEVLREGR